MTDILVVDAGSHSLRLVLVTPAGERSWERSVESPPGSPEADQLLGTFQHEIGGFVAVGHRIVHGGERITTATLVDDAVVAALDATAFLAPLHVPPAIRTLAQLRLRLPDVPHVVAVDTAFHADMPVVARTYALPAEWREQWDLRRYGFHGLSYASALPRTAAFLDKDPEDISCVMAHLGGGSSVCAVRHGRSVWTSMGQTPLDGLVMATRSGSVDPGLLLDLITHHGLAPADVRDALERRSGLLGLSDGLSNDTRVLVTAARGGRRAHNLPWTSSASGPGRASPRPRSTSTESTPWSSRGKSATTSRKFEKPSAAGLGPLGLRGGLSDLVDADAIISGPGASIPVIALTVQEDLQVATETRRVIETTKS